MIDRDSPSVIIIHHPTPILIRFPQTIPLRQILLLTLTLGVQIRALSLAAHAHSMAAMGRKAIRRRVVAHAVIPEGNVVLVPLEAGVDLGGGGDELVEEGNDVVGFGFGDADDFCDEAGVEEEGFPAGYCIILSTLFISGVSP